MLRFADESSETLPLIAGEHLRDNAIGVPDVIDTTVSPNVQEAFRSTTLDQQTIITMDLLSIEISNRSNLIEVTISDTSNGTIGSQDPTLNIYGITVERSIPEPRPPSAVANAVPRSGAAPLVVRFSGEGRDPDAGLL